MCTLIAAANRLGSLLMEVEEILAPLATDFDHVADLVINRSLGETLGEVDERIQALGE